MSLDVPIPSKLPLSEMKIALMVRQLDLGHILWCGRVVRVERAHRIRVVRGVQNLLDVGRHGVIDFDDVRFVVRERVVTGFFREDELVGRWAHPRVRDIEGLGEGWRGRSMRPARVTRRRRQSSRIAWDRARLVAAIGELEAIVSVGATVRSGMWTPI